MLHMHFLTWRERLAIVGVLFVVAAPFFFLIFPVLQQIIELRRSVDITQFIPYHEQTDPIYKPSNPIVQIKIDDNKGQELVINKSKNLIIVLQNDVDKPESYLVSIHATTYKKAPVKPQKIVLDPKGRESVLWNITPIELGVQNLLVQANSHYVPIKFTVISPESPTLTYANVLGWTSSILGPMLTVPWWIGFFQDRRDKKAEDAPKTRLILPPYLE